jgi:Plasma-membrane choline transporter
MVSVAIGLASGLVGVIMGFMDSGMFVDLGFEHAALPAFGIGFLAGFLFASIVMGVVGSAINTVIVCFCEDPRAFEVNHPQLSAEMRAQWTNAFPGLLS